MEGSDWLKMLGVGALPFLGYDMMTSDPTKGARGYLDQISPELHKYYDPYTQAGTNEINPYTQQLHQLMSDPTAMMNQIGAGYQESPGYKFQRDEALRAAGNAAGAQGMAGTPAAQQRAQTVAQGLASQDYNQYLQHALSQYGLGLQGEQGMVDMGGRMSSDLGQNLAQALMSQAGLSYRGDEGRLDRESKMFGNILGAIAPTPKV